MRPAVWICQLVKSWNVPEMPWFQETTESHRSMCGRVCVCVWTCVCGRVCVHLHPQLRSRAFSDFWAPGRVAGRSAPLCPFTFRRKLKLCAGSLSWSLRPFCSESESSPFIVAVQGPRLRSESRRACVSVRHPAAGSLKGRVLPGGPRF